MSIDQPVFFPAKELSEIERGATSRKFIELHRQAKSALPENHPLRKMGSKVLARIIEDRAFFTMHTQSELRGFVTGFQVYQDFSALTNARQSLPQWAAEGAAYDIIHSHHQEGSTAVLASTRRDYESALPETSNIIARISRALEQPTKHFTQGASLAHRLDLGARCLEILGKEYYRDKI